MMETRFTVLVGASAPIQVASMPGVSTPALVAAVANAGAVGMFGASGRPAPLLESDLEQIAKSTAGVFGVNFLMPFLDRACVAVAARRARIVEFFYGEPERALVDERTRAARVSWQVGQAQRRAPGAPGRTLCGRAAPRRAARAGQTSAAAARAGARPLRVPVSRQAASPPRDLAAMRRQARRARGSARASPRARSRAPTRTT
jgi:hypothetical protein